MDLVKDRKDAISRRRFIHMAWSSFFGAILVSTVASFRYLFPNILYEPESKVEVDRPEDYGLNGVVFYPENGFYILKDSKGIYALSGVCTHLACLITWVDSKKEFLCSCHGSVFTKEGTVLKPPAKHDLKHYKVTINRKGKMVVNLKRTVEQDFRLVV